jgi:hypothetical protein
MPTFSASPPKVLPNHLTPYSAPPPATVPPIATGINVQLHPPVKNPPKNAAPAPNAAPHMIIYYSAGQMLREMLLKIPIQNL